MKRLIFALLLFFPSVCQAVPTVGVCADGRPYDPCVIYVGPAGVGECDGGYNNGDCDYNDFATAETANDANLISGAYAVEFRMYDYVETAGMYLIGWSTSEAYDITIKGADSDRTATNTGIYSDERFRLEMNTGAYNAEVMLSGENFVTWENLQCKLTAPSGACCMGDNGAMIAGDRHYYLGNVFVMDLNGSTTTGMCPVHNEETSELGQYVVVANNIAYTQNTSAGAGFYCVWSELARLMYVYNNTCYGDWQGFALRTAGTLVNVNNIVYNGYSGAVCFSNNTSSENHYNICNRDETAPPGTGNIMNYTPTFVNAGAYDFHLAATAGNGQDLSSADGYNVTTDIDGDARSAPYSIGADHISGAAPPAAGYQNFIYHPRSRYLPWEEKR